MRLLSHLCAQTYYMGVLTVSVLVALLFQIPTLEARSAQGGAAAVVWCWTGLCTAVLHGSL